MWIEDNFMNGQSINIPQSAQVIISETDPGQKPLARAAVALGREQDQKLSLKASRAKLIEQVKASREIPLVIQEVLLAEIALIDAKHDVLRLDFVRHAHGVGGNGCWTVKEI
jgi:hypothetical protein